MWPDDIRLMPAVEQDELALVYQAKGIEPGIARQMAVEVMRDPERALGEQVREELKIGEAHATPFKEGWVTGASTDRKSTRLNSSHDQIPYAVFCLKKKKSYCTVD